MVAAMKNVLLLPLWFGLGSAFVTSPRGLGKLQHATPARPASRHHARTALCMKTAVLYSTQGGNTASCADQIAKLCGLEAFDIEDKTNDEIQALDGVIIGAPTWNTDCEDYRSGTAVDEFLYDRLDDIKLDGKVAAVFGLGDQETYGDFYCDAVEEIWTALSKGGAKMIGTWPTDGYNHEDSKAEVDGKFLGLTLDEDNQPELSEERCAKWVEQLKAEGMPF